MSKGFPQSVRDAVADRSKLLCEGCGGSGPLELHHRQYRSRGGSDLISNALALCGWGNHTGCHGIAHTVIGEQLGWSVRSGFDPAIVPVFHKADKTWWRQHDNAPMEFLRPADAVEYMQLIGALKSGSGFAF